MANNWDDSVDVLVVGTGAAGLSAAIAAADCGARVLVVESTGRWGGTTMRSGGGLWMPANPLMQRAGVQDSVENALTYMDATIGDVGPASSPQRRRAFVEAVPDVITSLERHGVRWYRDKDYPDYYPELPGGMIGRGVETLPFNAKRLGTWFQYSRIKDSVPLPLMTDDVWQLARAWSTPDGFMRGARLTSRTLGGIVRGRRLVGLGASLASWLMFVVRAQRTPVLLSTPLVELVVENGAVVGAVLGGPGDGLRRVGVTGGVVLAAGGFAHRTEWREKYHGVPGWSAAAEGDLGTGIEAGVAAGGALALMDDAWWGAGVPMETGMNGFVLSERSMPYSMVVDQHGDRFTNESASYIDFGHDLLAHNRTVPSIPSWLIMDSRARKRYLFTVAPTGTKALREAGTMVVADSLEDLARLLHIDPRRLAVTNRRFNRFAATGVDEDFRRGDSAYDRYYSDPSVGPNPNLGPIARGPFTAVKIVPGDLGTKGGLLTDEDARVLREDLAPIAGLYAAGNTTASVMGHTYPGPGSTIAPAVIFGHLGARHAATRALGAKGRD